MYLLKYINKKKPRNTKDTLNSVALLSSHASWHPLNSFPHTFSSTHNTNRKTHQPNPSIWAVKLISKYLVFSSLVSFRFSCRSPKNKLFPHTHTLHAALKTRMPHFNALQRPLHSIRHRSTRNICARSSNRNRIPQIYTSPTCRPRSRRRTWRICFPSTARWSRRESCATSKVSPKVRACVCEHCPLTPNPFPPSSPPIRFI